MAKVEITDIKATLHDGVITVTGNVNGQSSTIQFHESNVAEMNDKERKEFIRNRLLAQYPDLHGAYDLGFDKL